MTAGFVYSPSSFLGSPRRWTTTSIELTDGIQTTTAQQQIDNCQIFDIAESCAKITFNSLGQVTAITVTSLNVANSKWTASTWKFSYNFPGEPS